MSHGTLFPRLHDGHGRSSDLSGTSALLVRSRVHETSALAPLGAKSGDGARQPVVAQPNSLDLGLACALSADIKLLTQTLPSPSSLPGRIEALEPSPK